MSNELGDWRLVGWDSIDQRNWRDPARLAAAWSAAGLLLLGGIVGFRQQRRALRLAEERVSFVNRVSHELRTPVTNMLLNLDLARDHLGPSLNGAGARLDLVVEEAQRLGRLVANVLTFSRRDRTPPVVRSLPCRPDEIIASVLGQFARALERRRIEVVHAGAVSQEVLLEADALAQILANLISNVEKYAAAGGLVQVESRLAGGYLTVAVEDRGPGIAVEARERIFKPFERLSDRVDEGTTGTGLGLCIARDLAERMGGRLRLVALPVGARFELEVPTASVEVAR
jgi:signal transduction histidine kinase